MLYTMAISSASDCGPSNVECMVFTNWHSTRPNAGLSRREAVGFVPLVLPERSGGKEHRLSPAFSLSEAKGEPLSILTGISPSETFDDCGDSPVFQGTCQVRTAPIVVGKSRPA